MQQAQALDEWHCGVCLGTHQRGIPAMGKYNHKQGTGFVKASLGDYHDAIHNRKAIVRVLVHETFGSMSSFAAMRLRRLARDAAKAGCDGTDYRNTGTYSFLEHYSQRISAAGMMHGVEGMLKGVAQLRRAAARRGADGSAA